MTAVDRAQALCDILLGAAFADEFFHEREKDFVRAYLVALCGGELPRELAARIDAFSRDQFELAQAVSAFKNDDDTQRRDLLELVASLHESDEELDFAEDDYLRELAAALGAKHLLDGLTIDYESRQLRASLDRLGALPPPVPRGS